jgi:hypothetical protein
MNERMPQRDEPTRKWNDIDYCREYGVNLQDAGILRRIVELDFKYHAPDPAGTRPRTHESMRAMGRSLAVDIIKMVPNSRERSLALTKLEECIMWCNAGIAKHVRP